jgi:hypothetical protein
MKIEVVKVTSPMEESTPVVRLRVTGPVDPAHHVLQRARQLVANTGSKSMAESFDWALKTGLLTSEK